MEDKNYNDYESSSGGSDSELSDGGGANNEFKYISKIKKSSMKIGGVGDYADDDDFDEAPSDEDEEFAQEDWESGSEKGTEIEYDKKHIEQFVNDDDEDDDDNEDDDDDDEDDETRLQKFNDNLRKNVITEHHPELMIHNYHEVNAMCNIVRNERGIIIDPLHKTIPFITKYEKAKILGERAKQINAGAKPFINVSDEIIDGYVIAMMEFEQKKIPMIIRRPLPNNGCEYWRVCDLEDIL
jgi:DNA-directed RNA polymerase subunit K/omega